MAEYQIFQDEGGKWRWRLIGGNGEVIAASEAYESKANAERGAEDAKAAGGEASVGDED